MQWLQSALVGEYEAKPLQKSGELSRDQLLSFFSEARGLFESNELKMALALGYQQGHNVQDIVNAAQMKVFEDRVTPPVQGDFGIASLSSVLQRFGSDSAFLTIFYEFVHLEERALDEAEMPAAEFAAKYEAMQRMQEAFERSQEQNPDMSDEERQRVKARMYKALVDASVLMAQPPCCSSGACTSGMHTGTAALPPAPGDAPRPEEPPPSRAEVPPTASAPAAGNQGMSQAETMAFFQSMARAPK